MKKRKKKQSFFFLLFCPLPRDSLYKKKHRIVNKIKMPSKYVATILHIYVSFLFIKDFQ